MLFLIKLILASILGSLIAYFSIIIFPSSQREESTGVSIEKRLKKWNKVIKMDKRLLAFDLVFSCVFVSIAYTIVILEVVSCTQALLGGMTAEAAVYHYLHNARIK